MEKVVENMRTIVEYWTDQIRAMTGYIFGISSREVWPMLTDEMS